MKKNTTISTLITAGSTYLDIDAYACMVALAELLRLKGENAVAYSSAVGNYSVCTSLVEESQVRTSLPAEFEAEDARYIIVDVSDPEYIKESVPLDRVTEVYDHHVGFEEYWQNRIGDKAQIEFIGAAATLIYRQWKKAELQGKMTRSTALLLIAAILDNTLNLSSANTTDEDVEAFNDLCKKAGVGEEWRDSYFSEVQACVEADLKNALFKDMKRVRDNPCLPPRVAQLTVWNVDKVLSRLDQIREWFSDSAEGWMINLIDIKNQCSYFVCDDADYQKRLEGVFEVEFESGIAKTATAYLRKEIIKKTKFI